MRLKASIDERKNINFFHYIIKPDRKPLAEMILIERQRRQIIMELIGRFLRRASENRVPI
jgi:hypothetical protein